MSTDIARPENPVPFDTPDPYAACRAFVLAYALPALPPDNVIQGWRNSASLPAGTNDYAVIGILADKQLGTPVTAFTAEETDTDAPGVLSVSTLRKLQARIEFYAEDDIARQRASRLSTIAASAVGVRFFNDYGMSCLYADEVCNVSHPDESKQFLRCYAATLHLSMWEGCGMEMPYFDTAKIARLENVEQHHPGKTE